MVAPIAMIRTRRVVNGTEDLMLRKRCVWQEVLRGQHCRSSLAVSIERRDWSASILGSGQRS